MREREREGGKEFVYEGRGGGGRNGRLISNGSNLPWKVKNPTTKQELPWIIRLECMLNRVELKESSEIKINMECKPLPRC
jgi:hypothetical protein